jgi:hypothetical protein
MSISPQQTRLAELLGQLEWSQADLARVSRLSPATVHRALGGAQTSALTRSRIVAAINAQRAELQQPELARTKARRLTLIDRPASARIAAQAGVHLRPIKGIHSEV